MKHDLYKLADQHHLNANEQQLLQAGAHGLFHEKNHPGSQCCPQKGDHDAG